MSYNKIFEMGVWKTAFNTNLKEYCYNIQSSDKGRTLTNVNGYQSHSLNQSDKELQPLISHLQSSVQDYIDSFLTFERPIKLQNMWININRHGSSNNTHTHPQSYFSGVYYVSKPANSGNIVFEHMGIDTINSYWPFIQSPYQKDYNGKNSVQYQFESNTGDCLMFPSYYRHYVRPNLSNENRISISFNFG